MRRLKQSCKRCTESTPAKVCFWCILQSIAFPIEHFIWTRLPGFSSITRAMGLA